MGIRQAEAARLLAVTTPTIATALRRTGSEKVYLVNNVALITDIGMITFVKTARVFAVILLYTLTGLY